MTAARLKASILQLAVTGKLVPQDPADEPAGELLERIKAEKTKLVKTSKIKQDKNPSEIIAGSDGVVYEKFKDGTVKDISGELPFEIPNNWAWVRLDHCLISLHTGLNPRRFFRLNTADAKNYYVTIRELKNNKVVFSERTDRIDDEALRLCNGRSDLDEGDVLFAGTGSIGVMALVEEKPTNWNIKEGVYALKPFRASVFPRFLLYALQSEAIRSLFMQKAVGSTIASVPMKSLLSLFVPLPPLAEQKRIVAKIEELMPLVEEYGKLEEKRIQLDADLPGALEKAILQDAIQGKLVPQDPAEGTGEELLRKIFAAKNAKGTKKETRAKSARVSTAPSLPCPVSDPPFEIPTSWAWCKFGTFCEVFNGNSINAETKRVRYSKKCDGYDYIGTANVGFDSTIDYDNGVYIPRNEPGFKIAPKESVLMCIEGGSAARKIAVLDRDVTFGNKLCCFVSLPVLPRYIYAYLKSPAFQTMFADEMKGIIGGVGPVALKGFPIPLPPLAEQKRIVAKVEQLLAAVRKLKTEADR